jgi:hypothetical protein
MELVVLGYNETSSAFFSNHVMDEEGVRIDGIFNATFCSAGCPKRSQGFESNESILLGSAGSV